MYLLQIRTNDFGLQLRTEITAETIKQLQLESKQMVSANPEVKGLTYGIYKIEKLESGKFESETLKIDTIAA